MFKKILLPTDFSAPAGKALPHALALARRFEADLLLLYVRTLFSDDPGDPDFQFFDEGKYRNYVQDQLTQHRKALEGHSRVSSETILNVSAAAGILDYTRDNDVDVIVMGTHGRSALGHFFLGSVAEKVVRYAKCPVLTIAHHRENYLDRPDYRHVLAAFDFSRYSKNAVRQAWKLAQKYDARLEVLYVVEQNVPPPFYRRWKMSIQHDLGSITQEMRDSLGELLGEEAIQHLQIHVETGDGNGKAHSEITKYARAQAVDLLVLGTHGLSGVEHMLLGSTTERLVRTAPCPVLTFHLEGEA